MHANMKNIILTNWPIKIISLILGYTFWLALGSRLITDQWVTVPLSFYNSEKGMKISAPETVQVALRGSRTDLANLNKDQLAAHIDASKLKKGTQLIELSAGQLLLPHSVRMVYYKPSNLVITVSS